MRLTLDTRTAARRTRVGDDRPLPVAVAAGLGDREEPLLEADLSRAAALRTRPRHRPGLGAAASARLAGGEARHGDGLLAAEGRLLEADVEVVAEVLPATHPGAAARPARPEEVPEQVTDDVLEACSEVEARGPGALLEGGVPEAVVHRPPLRIREHLVRLGELLEALFRLAVPGILVGVVLMRQLAESFLDLLVSCVAGDAEHLVVVALHEKTKALTRPRQVRACLLSAPRSRKPKRALTP